MLAIFWAKYFEESDATCGRSVVTGLYTDQAKEEKVSEDAVDSERRHVGCTKKKGEMTYLNPC